MSSSVLWLCGLLSLLVIEANGQRQVNRFTSPKYPNPYTVGAGDTFEATSSKTEQISFIFNYIYLHAVDYVKFSPGSKYLGGLFFGCSSSEFSKQFIGTKLGYDFAGVSTGDTAGKACVISSYSRPSIGDNSSVNAFEVLAYAYERCPSPSAPYVLTAKDFYLASPLYPSKYPTRSDCRWDVQPPSDPAQRIRVVVEKMQLTLGDHLELSNVNGQALLVDTTGTYLSDSNTLRLRFISTASTAGTGYQLYYRLVGCKSGEIREYENAHITNPASFYDSNYELQRECNAGWKFASGLKHEYTVCQGGTWTWRDMTAPSGCIRVTCDALTQPENGYFTLSDATNAGSVASFSCQPGFQLIGDRTITCGVDGSWSGSEVLPQCINSSANACGSLVAPSNGEWNCVSTPTSRSQSTGGSRTESEHCVNHESVQELVCNEGYFVDGPSSMAKCNYTVWTNLPLHCTLHCCSNLSEAVALEPHLNYHSDGLCYESSLEFFCDTGYILVGQAARLCGSQGSWLPSELIPSCRIADCGPPPVPDTNTTSVSFSSTQYNAQAHYSCLDPEKYQLIGPETLTCLQEEKWSSDASNCAKKQCYISDLHLIVPGAAVQPVKLNYYVDDNITVTCSDKSATVTCSPTGWQNVDISGPCDSSLRYLGNIQSPKYPNAYYLEPQTVSRVAQALENERIIYVVNEVSINIRDTLTFSTVSTTSDARDAQCSTHWIKQYEGQAEFKSAADVVFTPYNESCTTFSVAEKPQPGSGRRGFDIDIYAMNVCPSAQDGYVITESAFYIASPNYPYVFPMGDVCTWFIAPSQCYSGQRLALNIEYVRTKRNENQACLHQLTVGPVNGGPLTLCGYHDNVPVMIDACTAVVSFDARASIELSDQGFFLSYRTVGCALDDLPTKGKAKLFNPVKYFESGYVATFQCDQGSYFKSGAELEYVLCDDNGMWKPLGADTTCTARLCDTKVNVVNGVTKVTGDGSYGTVISVTCKPGYELVGEASLTCTASGAWSAPVPSCISDTDTSCSNPSILHGRLMCEVGDAGTDADELPKCHLLCDSGYYASHSGEVTCNQGVLSPADLNCVAVRCGNITQNDKNLAWAQVDDTVGSLVEFYCKPGYDFDGPDTAECSSEGRWTYSSAGEPKCVVATCEAPPSGVRLEVLYYEQPTYEMQATYTCARAYQLVGTNRLICGALGNWMGTLPYCVPKTCYTSEILAVVPEATVWPLGAVAVSQSANVTCGDKTAETICTESGWNLDSLYVAGCLIRPSPSPDSLKEVSNVTFDYSTVEVTQPYVTATTFSASNKKNRIVFVTRYANLKDGDTLSYHVGASSAPAISTGTSSRSSSNSASVMASEQSRCSASASQLLRTYSGGLKREFDIVYATETACAQLKLQPSNGTMPYSTVSVGFSVQAFEIESCPSALQPATFIESQFMIASPHYPRSYSALESCSWNIKPWQCEQGQALEILVAFADIPQPHELRFTLANSSEVRVSGSVQNRQFLTDSCDVNAFFDTSGNAEPGKGFEFTYKVTGCSHSAIPISDHVYVVNPQDVYLPGYVVQLQCALGTQFESGVSVQAAVCAYDNTWQPTATLSSCVPVVCGALPQITNGQSNPPAPIVDATYGTNVTFTCNENYVLVGEKVVMCQANGQWSGAPPVCSLPSDVYDCSEPLASHVQFTCVSRQAGCVSHEAEQLGTCAEGYELSGASASIKCRNATWIPEPQSVCKRKCCPDINELAANVSAPASIDVLTGQCYQDTVVFTCALGYNIAGPAQAVCTADASWSAHVPSCQIVQCEESMPPTDGVLHATTNGSTYGSYMMYYCDTGYQLSGESSRLCQADGKWSGSEPLCAPNQCLSEDLKIKVPGLIILDEVPVYYFGESARVSCGAVDSVNVLCGAEGWDTEALYSAGCLTTPSVPTTVMPTSTTLRVVTTSQPITFDVPRYVTNIASPNYPNEYPPASAAVAATVSNGGFSDERVVFFVKVANLRAGDSLKLYSRASASASACLDSKALKQYVGSSDENGNSYGGQESDYIVTSGSSACYLFDSVAQQSAKEAQPIGYYVDIYSLADCPSDQSNYTLKASSFALASPNYPSAYPVKKQCRWNIAPTCSRQRLRLQFDAFDVACGHVVQIDDADTSESYCGLNKPTAPIVVQTCKASVTFDTTAPASAASGFRMSYSVIGCGEDQLPTRQYASFSAQDFYDAGVQVNYTCAVGMRFESGKQVERVQCSAKYQWQIVDEPTDCVPVTCQMLAAPENGKVNVVSNEYKGQAYFSCDGAFDLVGNSVLTCTENGSWSGAAPTCRPKSYQPCVAPNLANSVLTCVANCSTVDGAYVHGAVLQSKCNQGYELLLVSRMFSCSNGTWIPSVTDCTRICCSPYKLVGTEQSLQRLQPSAVAPGSCFNDTVGFSCPVGYNLVGATQAVCGADKKWTPSGTPYCEPVKCDALLQTQQLQVSSTCNTLTYGCSVSFSCSTGYSLEGQSLGACDERGKWSNLPKCNVNTCAVNDLRNQLPPGALLDASVGSTSKVEYGTTVGVSCLSDKIQVKCGAQSWETGALCSRTCVPNYCSTQQITEIATAVGASVSFPSNVGSTVEQGQTVTMTCWSKDVATATCGAVTWETDSLDGIRSACESWMPTTTTTPTTVTTTAGTTRGSTTIRSTEKQSTLHSAVQNSTTQPGNQVTEQVATNSSNAVVLGLAVGCGVLAVALVASLLYIYCGKSKAPLPRQRFVTNTSLNNPVFHNMESLNPVNQTLEVSNEVAVNTEINSGRRKYSTLQNEADA